MRTKIHLFWLCCLFFPTLLFSQQPTIGLDSRITSSKVDTLGNDSLKVSITKTLKVSKDALDEPVEYEAKDSIIFENAKNLVHLYGNAIVRYQTMEVKAAYIVLDVKENMATAEGRKDSLGRMAGFPDFKDKEQTFKSEKMRYNFKSKKGIIYEAQSKQQSLYVLGEKTKFVGKKDSADYDVIYSKNAILTTCSDPHPHFGIRAQKMKVIANKLIVVGPSNLEIGNVPTPVWLPFGFYPVTNNKQTGLIFPEQYGYIRNLGLGFEGLGWYFPINDHFDARITSSLIANGTYGVNANVKYNYRYRMSGDFTIDYKSLAQRKEITNADGKSSTEKIIRETPITIRWFHSQDSKARPNQTFSASVNISTNASLLQRNTQNSVRDVSQNNNNSNINYSRRFPNKPFSISAGLNHSQNIATHDLALDPNINLQVNQIYPLKKLVRTDKEDFLNEIFEGFNIQTGARALARVNTYDTLLFRKATIDRMRAGLSYSASVGAPFKAFKYFTITPSASFDQYLHFDQVQKVYKDSIVREKYDSTFEGRVIQQQRIKSYGAVQNVKTWGLAPVSTFNASVSLNTNIYGTKQFRKGYFRGIRHQINLSSSFNFGPNLDNYVHSDSVRLERTSLNDPIRHLRYTRLDGSVMQAPRAVGFGDKNYIRPRGTKTISIGTKHNLEVKVKGKKDSIARKIKILQGFDVSTTINLNSDSLEMTSFSPNFNQRILYNLVTLNLRTNISPYVQGRRSNGKWGDTRQYLWNEASLVKVDQFRIPKPVTFQGGEFSIGTSFSYTDIKNIIDKKKKVVAQDTVEAKRNPKKADSYKSIWSLIESFRVSHTMNFDIDKNMLYKDSLSTRTNSLAISGTIPLSKYWSLGFNNIGYDFKARTSNYSAISISRNLHCWDLSGEWYPARGTFLFTLRVKDAPLDFIKAPIQKQNADAFGGYRF
jgi:LptD protein